MKYSFAKALIFLWMAMVASASISFTIVAQPPCPPFCYPSDPILEVTPEAGLNFSDVILGSSKDLTFIVKNKGGGNLTGSVITSAPFSVMAGNSFNLGEGASQTVVIRFSPTQTGNMSRTVDFTSNVGSLTRTVTGNGVEMVQPPSAPSNLLAAGSTNEINLSWQDNASNEDGFRVYRDGTLIATKGPNTTTYTDSGLTTGSNFCYTVKAYNLAGESNASNQACATTSSPPPAGSVDFLWTSKADIPEPKSNAAVAVVNNKIYLIGGNSFLRSYEYDPAQNTWRSIAVLDSDLGILEGGAAVVNNRIYVVGPQLFPTDSTAIRIYDPSTNSWSRGAPIPTPRQGTRVVALNGKIYAIGGEGSRVVEVYDPATNSWSTKAPMLYSRGFAAAGVINGKIYMIGGSSGGNILNNIEVYDPNTDTWTEVVLDPFSPNCSRKSHTAFAVLNEKIYLFGGRGGCDGDPQRVDEFDPATRTFTQKNYLKRAREYGHVAAVVNGKVYVIGGGDQNTAAFSAVEEGTITQTCRPVDAPILYGPNGYNTSGSFVINWSTVPTAATYIIEEDDTFEFTSPSMIYNGLITSLNFSAKTQGFYYYRVRAQNSCGASPWSGFAWVIVDWTPPNDVTGLTSTSHGLTLNSWIPGKSNNNQITLNWAPATDNVSGIAGYSIECRNQAAHTFTPDQVVETRNPLFTINAPDGNNVFCAVRTGDWAGNWTSTAFIGPFFIDTAPPEYGPPTRVPEPNANGWNNTEVKINFPCNDALSGPINAFIVKTVIDEGNNQTVIATSSECIDKAGNSATADASLRNFNIDKSSPSLVTDLFITGSDGQCTLTWTNPADNISGLAEVVVRRRLDAYPTNENDGDQAYQTASPIAGEQVSLTDSSLSAGTTYYYAVFSKDRADNWNRNVEEASNAGVCVAQVLTAADLVLTKNDTPDPVMTGDILTYTVTVANNGPDPATGVMVTDSLPGGVIFISATPSQGSCSGTNTITCNLGTLNNGANATITIVVTPTVTGTIINTVTATANETDPNENNNTVQASTTIRQPEISGTATAYDKQGQPVATVQLDSPMPKIAVKPKSGTRTDCQSQSLISFCRNLPKEVKINTIFSVTQRVKNTGSSTLPKIQMQDILPPNARLVSGNLAKTCINVKRNRTCSNTYKIKIVLATTSAAEGNVLKNPNIKNLPISNGAMIFSVEGQTIKDIQVSIFNLSGRLVFASDWVPNGFIWHGQNTQERYLANGVYFYIVRLRSLNGGEYVSEIRKFVILR